MSKQYVNERDRTLYGVNFDLLQGLELTERGYPVLKPLEEMPKIDEFIGFDKMLSDKRPGNHGVHFFVDDYQFERVWNKPIVYMEKLKRFKCVVQTQFSSYTDFPAPLRQYQHYRNQLMGAFWQSQGLTVIPTPGWSGDDSFDWTYEGQPENSWVAVSTVGVTRYADARLNFIRGLRRYIDAFHPKGIIAYGKLTLEFQTILEKNDIPYVNFRSNQTLRIERYREKHG